MIPFTRQPLSTIEPIAPQNLVSGGAAMGHVPLWNGTQYTPANPLGWLQNGVFQGRVSEVNIIGSATSSVVGGTVTLNIGGTAGGLSVNGQPVTSLNTGTGITAIIGGGTATLNGMSFFRSEQVNSGGVTLYTNNIRDNFGLQFEAGNNISLLMTTLANGTRIRLDAASGTTYTHPTYTAMTLTPSIVGNTLNTHTIITNTIGSVVNAIPVSLTFPTGSTTTLTASGFGAALFTGLAPNYTMKGLRSLTPSNLNITDNGTSLDFSFTPTGVQTLQNGLNTTAVNLGGNAWRVDVNTFVSGVTSVNGSMGAVVLQAGSNMSIVNLGGSVFRFDAMAGASSLTGTSGNGLTVGANSVSLALASLSNAGAMPQLNGNVTQFLNAAGQWATPTVSGTSGVSSFNSATGAITLVNGLNSTVANLGGGAFAVNVSIPSGTSGINILNTGAAFMTNVTTLDVWGGTLQNIAPGFARLVLPTGSGGGITGIQVNFAGNYTNLNFAGNVSVAGNTITVLGGGGGSYTHPSYTPRNFTPTLIGNQLTVMGINSDVEGHVFNVTPFTFTLPSSGGALPSGVLGRTLYHNGSTWESTTMIRVIPDNFIQLFSGNFGQYTTIVMENDRIDIGGNSVRLNAIQLGFFGVTPINRPTTTNDITSVRNALIALGLIS